MPGSLPDACGLRASHLSFLSCSSSFVIEGQGSARPGWVQVGWSDEAGRDLTRCDTLELALQRLDELRAFLAATPGHGWTELRLVRRFESSQLVDLAAATLPQPA